MANIGFIGLGIMGRAMAGHLLTSGHRSFAYSRTSVPDELLKNGAIRLQLERRGCEQSGDHDQAFAVISMSQYDLVVRRCMNSLQERPKRIM